MYVLEPYTMLRQENLIVQGERLKCQHNSVPPLHYLSTDSGKHFRYKHREQPRRMHQVWVTVYKHRNLSKITEVAP